MQTTIITGIAGQCGSYMAEHLLARGDYVVGIDRRKSTVSGLGSNVRHLESNPNFEVVYGDIKDASFINRLVAKHRPHFYYNLAASSHVGQSFAEPVETFRTNAEAVLIALEAIRLLSKETRFLQASTSEQWGNQQCPESGFSEDFPFHPRSPYGVAKLMAYWAVVNYRESYNMFACNSLLFNNESPRRGSDFVTRKITLGIGSIARGEADKIVLGNMDACRDWGYAKEYTEAQIRILNYSQPEEFVIATGESYSVRDFLRFSLQAAGLDSNNWEQYVEFDSRFMRPSEVPYLKGNSAKAKSVLGWEAEIKAPQLAKLMTDYDLNIKSP